MYLTRNRYVCLYTHIAHTTKVRQRTGARKILWCFISLWNIQGLNSVWNWFSAYWTTLFKRMLYINSVYHGNEMLMWKEGLLCGRKKACEMQHFMSFTCINHQELFSSLHKEEESRVLVYHAVCLCPFQPLNQLPDCHETWYECYAVGGHLNPVF
jgi:hypothetical protein